MESLKKYLSECFYILTVLWLKALQHSLYWFGLRRDITLPPGRGAAGRNFRVTRVNGMPVLWSGRLPYPTYRDESNHTVHMLNGAWKMRFDSGETGRREKWQDTTDFGPEWIDTEILWVPRTRFSQNHAQLARRIPSRQALSPGGGLPGFCRALNAFGFHPWRVLPLNLAGR